MQAMRTPQQESADRQSREASRQQEQHGGT
jgi:hypothetical protein